MSDEKLRAYKMAMDAAELDFEAAISGLIAGHAKAMQDLQSKLADKDRAFLIALSLTEKGARLDKEGFMAKKVVDAVCENNMCEVEKKFVQRAESATNQTP